MTATVSTLPTSWAVFRAALRRRRPVWLSYHGRRRLICPHALGWHNDRPVVLGYQTGGETSNGALPADPRQRWRVFFVDEANDVVADMAAPWGTAENYNPTRPFPAVDEVVAAVPGPGDGT
ncbi:MAG: hypothetical protein M0005_04150 [Actinomycetota bacterium]|nr:hypothetical protein [Actinomycetota bacterium]